MTASPIRYDTGAGLLHQRAARRAGDPGDVGCGRRQDAASTSTSQWTGGDPTMMSRNWSNPMYFPDPAGSFGIMWAPDRQLRPPKGRWKPDDALRRCGSAFATRPISPSARRPMPELMAYDQERPAGAGAVPALQVLRHEAVASTGSRCRATSPTCSTSAPAASRLPRSSRH